VIRGTLDGRSGSFVLQHGGILSPEGTSSQGTIVPGTGTGELADVRGDGTIAADEDGNHTLTLDYELP
jgi:hypothetical protein